MIGDSKKKDLQDQRDALAEELGAIRAELKALRRERDDTTRADRLAQEIEGLQRKIVELEIKESKIQEEHAREKREVEHFVGLEKKRQAQEIELARRDTELRVRQENLDADKARFKGEMDFQREHLQREVDRVERILTAVLERLPDISATLKVVPGGGGKTGTDDD